MIGGGKASLKSRGLPSRSVNCFGISLRLGSAWGCHPVNKYFRAEPVPSSLTPKMIMPPRVFKNAHVLLCCSRQPRAFAGTPLISKVSVSNSSKRPSRINSANRPMVFSTTAIFIRGNNNSSVSEYEARLVQRSRQINTDLQSSRGYHFLDVGLEGA